jgi:hypothetical protein
MPVQLRRPLVAVAILSVGFFGPIPSAIAEEFEVEFPAGDFCPGFAVLGDITVKGSEKTLPGSRFWEHNVGTGVWTNAENGQTFTQRSRYASVAIYDEAANDYHVTIDGRYLIGFYAGDMGLAGMVTETQTYSVAGHQTFTYDVDTDAIIAYSLDGKVLADVCAVLAEEN